MFKYIKIWVGLMLCPFAIIVIGCHLLGYGQEQYIHVVRHEHFGIAYLVWALASTVGVGVWIAQDTV